MDSNSPTLLYNASVNIVSSPLTKKRLSSSSRKLRATAGGPSSPKNKGKTKPKGTNLYSVEAGPGWNLDHYPRKVQNEYPQLQDLSCFPCDLPDPILARGWATTKPCAPLGPLTRERSPLIEHLTSGLHYPSPIISLGAETNPIEAAMHQVPKPARKKPGRPRKERVGTGHYAIATSLYSDFTARVSRFRMSPNAPVEPRDIPPPNKYHKYLLAESASNSSSEESSRVDTPEEDRNTPTDISLEEVPFLLQHRSISLRAHCPQGKCCVCGPEYTFGPDHLTQVMHHMCFALARGRNELEDKCKGCVQIQPYLRPNISSRP
ncbi:hypothetical protein M422DRAFT_23243 [Sphaerobolus stellatus SS14]|nr:hypothetical protein M422DRAFT_23243 [Sphaerobolus stellatus SS14]